MIDRITKDEFGTSAPLAQNRLLPAATGVKGYSLFKKELFDWYRENKPNSGLPSRIVVGILYDDYLKHYEKI